MNSLRASSRFGTPVAGRPAMPEVMVVVVVVVTAVTVEVVVVVIVCGDDVSNAAATTGRSVMA